MPKRSFYVRDSELDDYQVRIINKRTDNSFIVKGCAGSGKSILALWKAKQIQNENKGSYQMPLLKIKTQLNSTVFCTPLQGQDLTEERIKPKTKSSK